MYKRQSWNGHVSNNDPISSNRNRAALFLVAQVPASLNNDVVQPRTAGETIVARPEKTGSEAKVHLKMHWRARMRRTEDPITPFGFASGFFRSCNNSFPGSTRLHDIVVEGGRYVSNQKQGSAIAIAANRVIIRNMTIPTWSRRGENDPAAYQVSAMFLFGNDFSVHNNLVSGPTSNIESEFVFPGYDGIHIWGGKGASLMNNQIRAGDDGIGLFPLTQFEVDVAGFPIFPVHLYNYNISDVEVYNLSLIHI